MTDKTAKLSIVILAAGKGTRMVSALPKVMHKIAGEPMIAHILRTAAALNPEKIIVVTAPGMDEVAQAVKPHETVVQRDQRGTADAVKSAAGALKDFTGTVLVLYGDGPLYTPRTLGHFLANLKHSQAEMGYLGMQPDDPTGYGRLMTDKDGYVTGIVEEKDADATQKKIPLCWTGVMAGQSDHLWGWLDRVGNKNAKGEYYLTDLPAIALKDGAKTMTAMAPIDETRGANSRAELAQLEEKMQDKLRKNAMEGGATLIDPKTVYFSADTKIGKDVVIEPGVFFGPGVTIGDNVTIHAFSHLENVQIKNGVSIGPFARLRKGVILEEGVQIGNFVEVKNSHIDKASKAMHLAYIGDAQVGQNCNIGAGTITCNYNGFEKNKTLIGDRVFVGSNSSLLAPVKIDDGAIIGAGSVVVKDVPADSIYLERNTPDIRIGAAVEYRARKGAK